mgnify:FL=1
MIFFWIKRILNQYKIIERSFYSSLLFTTNLNGSRGNQTQVKVLRWFRGCKEWEEEPASAIFLFDPSLPLVVGLSLISCVDRSRMPAVPPLPPFSGIPDKGDHWDQVFLILFPRCFLFRIKLISCCLITRIQAQLHGSNGSINWNSYNTPRRDAVYGGRWTRYEHTLYSNL